MTMVLDGSFYEKRNHRWSPDDPRLLLLRKLRNQRCHKQISRTNDFRMCYLKVTWHFHWYVTCNRLVLNRQCPDAENWVLKFILLLKFKIEFKLPEIFLFLVIVSWICRSVCTLHQELVKMSECLFKILSGCHCWSNLNALYFLKTFIVRTA